MGKIVFIKELILKDKSLWKCLWQQDFFCIWYNFWPFCDWWSVFHMIIILIFCACFCHIFYQASRIKELFCYEHVFGFETEFWLDFFDQFPSNVRKNCSKTSKHSFFHPRFFSFRSSNYTPKTYIKFSLNNS